MVHRIVKYSVWVVCGVFAAAIIYGMVLLISQSSITGAQ